LPCHTQSSSCCNSGGGGRGDHPRQYRRNITQGSNHARTWRNATSHVTPVAALSRRCVFSRSTVVLVVCVVINCGAPASALLAVATATQLVCHQQTVKAQHTNAQCRLIA
jgi:hypothetical protein